MLETAKNGLDEIDAMPRYAFEQYTTNARVLWGKNPCQPPVRSEFAEDAAFNCESIARVARNLCYPWTSSERKQQLIQWVTEDVERLVENMHAMRTGTFPKSRCDLLTTSTDTDGARWLAWVDAVRKGGIESDLDAWATAINRYVRSCFHELAAYLDRRHL